jgi:hypothetical protein
VEPRWHSRGTSNTHYLPWYHHLKHPSFNVFALIKPKPPSVVVVVVSPQFQKKGETETGFFFFFFFVLCAVRLCDHF